MERTPIESVSGQNCNKMSSDAASLDTSKVDLCKEYLDVIVGEYTILNDLYYRNFNQHGGTQVFGLLKKVLQLMRSSYVMDGTNVLQGIGKSFNDIIYSKIKLGNGPFYQHCFQKYFQALSIYVHGIKLCIRMHLILQTLLRSRLFLPIYSVLIASISSLLRHFANISISMYEKCLIFVKFMREQKVNIDVGVANIRKDDNGNLIMSVQGLTVSVLQSIVSGKEYHDDREESIIINKYDARRDTSHQGELSRESQHQDASKASNGSKDSKSSKETSIVSQGEESREDSNAVQVDILSIRSEMEKQPIRIKNKRSSEHFDGEESRDNDDKETKKKKKKKRDEIDQIFGAIG